MKMYSVSGADTSVDPHAATNLTTLELLVLGWLAVRGERGTTYRDPYPYANERHVMEAIESLIRFGYVHEAGPIIHATRAKMLTDAGRTRHARNETDRYGGCPGCIRNYCVCAYSGSCIVKDDPLAPEGLAHHTGCHGTHD